MTYKILVVKNRIKSHKIKKAIDWFKGKVPVDFSIEELVTDFDVTTKKMSNATFSGVVCGDDLYDKLRSVIPEHKYHCVIFAFGNDLNGIRVNYTPYLPLYKHTDLIQLCDVNKYDRANHEVFHAFIHKAQRQGATFDDPMDSVIYQGKVRPYFNNNIINAVPSNRSIALDLLKTWWDKILKLDDDIPVKYVIISREKSDSKQTLGFLEARNGDMTFYCRTLELPWLDNKRNISCIPKGTYDVVWTFSPRFLKYTYEILGVPNRSGIRIHSANFYHQLNGCVALGNNVQDINKDGQKDVINSKITVDAFNSFMGKKSFKLTIN